ncbi:hypothetical protein ACIBF1_21690 [Spirillospora sp. NPDC050679]
MKIIGKTLVLGAALAATLATAPAHATTATTAADPVLEPISAAIAAHDDYSVALKSDGSLVSWGRHMYEGPFIPAGPATGRLP